MHDIQSGKDVLLYEDRFCYIVDNGNTHINMDGKLVFAKKRISLIIKKHVKRLGATELARAESTLINVIRKKFKLTKDKNFFLRTTMGTYPDHFHIHAYVLPFKKTGRIISG